MKTCLNSKSGRFIPRLLFAVALCSVSLFFAALSFAVNPGTPGWSVVTSPSKDNGNFTSNWPYAITCQSASDCWAVGFYLSNQSGYPYDQTLIEHWNGAAWSIVSSPNTSPTQNSTLSGVACTSASNCWAVGSLIERWDGNTWTIFNQPISGMNAVTCISASDCWAVGSTRQLWGGAAWQDWGSPANALYSVSCVSGSDCWAVGLALIEHWDGTSWTTFPEPNNGGEFGNPDSLTGVSCTSASDCWAVGAIATGDETVATLTEHWNGHSWSIVSSPNPASDSSALSNVTCVSASACWAVGSYNPPGSGYTRTLVEYWNGSSWAIVDSPNPSARYNRLRGVTCGSVSQCWAVGDQYTASGAQVTMFQEYSPSIPPLVAIGSRKIHGSTPFDVDLLNASPAIECRSPGATGTNGVDYKVIFTFANDVTNCGSLDNGLLTNGPATNQCTANLLSIPNAQYQTVTLTGVLDAQNNSGNVSATMGVLIGDVNASGLVDSGDVFLVRQQTSQSAGAGNFRDDVNATGLIDSGDVFITRQHTSNSLPTPP